MSSSPPMPTRPRREPLFQKAPKNAEEAARFGPLDIPPDQVLEMDEDEWYAKVYRGAHVPQLTIRAVLLGTFLGFFLAFTNLYVGLMTGWGLGVALTACILSFALWNGFMAIGIARSPMTILETNCMQSTASAAGYATGSTMVSAIPAMLMLGHELEPISLVLWTLLLGALGTVMAIPMKRNLINRERLRFPSGTAAAATLQALYSQGAIAAKKAKALLWAMAAGGVFPVFIDMKLTWAVEAGERVRAALLPADSKLFDWIPAFGTHVVDGKTEHYKPSDWTLVMDHNPVMIGAGAIIGIRIAFWMLIGNLALNYALGPEGLTDAWTNAAGATVMAVSKPWKAWKESGIWFGVPMMVTSGLLAFALGWRTIARA
ncbi:MAG: OPT/YSL family transporter, partial [Myxococcales bacterium]|nr:OPT/YSL family transporter [Myxococcales bacterium]